MTSADAIKRQSTMIEPMVPGLTTEGSGVAAIGNNLLMDASGGRIRKAALTILFILFAGAVSLAGIRYANPAIRSDLVAFTVDTDTQTTIRFQVYRKDPKVALTCRIIARDITTAIVGDRYTEVVPTSAKTIEIKEAIPTRTRAVTASVVRCLPKDR